VKQVLILRSNAVDPDPRVEKIARWLSEAGYGVTVLCWDRERKSEKSEKREGFAVLRSRIPGKYGGGLRNAFSLFLFNAWLLFNLMWRNYDLVHACDFDTIIPAFIAAKIRRKKVVFDIFDLYSEAHLEGAPAVIRKIVRSLEVFFINRTDAVVIADELRKEQLKGSKPRVLVVIYNVPDIEPNLYDLTINTGPREKLKIGYVGILQNGRMLEELLRVVSESQDLELLIAGFGKLERKVLEASKAFDNIRFFGRVNYNDALNIYKQCDVIFAVYDPSVPNHKYSSPNKVFEAMALGKPVIVAENTGIDQLVRSANLGFVVRYGDVEQLRETFNRIKRMTDYEVKSLCERAIKLFEAKYSPQSMKHTLLSLYSKLTKKGHYW